MRPRRGKQKLYEAALRLFESNGYFDTTVARITAEAGVSKGLVYNYFDSKEALLAGLLKNATRTMMSVADALASDAAFEDSPAEFLDGDLGFLQTERRFLKMQLSFMLMPELRAVVGEPQRRRAAALLAVLSGWFGRAGVAEPETKARLFLAMLDGVALHCLFTDEHYPLASMKSPLVQAAMDLRRSTRRAS